MIAKLGRHYQELDLSPSQFCRRNCPRSAVWAASAEEMSEFSECWTSSSAAPLIDPDGLANVDVLEPHPDCHRVTKVTYVHFYFNFALGTY